MKLTLGKKLGLGFGVILSLMVFSATVAHLKSGKIMRSQDAAFEVRVPSLKGAIRLQRDLNQTQVKGRQAILAGTEPARLAETKKLFDGTWSDIEKDMAGMDQLAPKWEQENRDRLNELKKQLPLLRAVQEAAIKRAAGREHGAVVKAGNDSAEGATPINIGLKKSLGTMAESFDRAVDQSREELNADNRSLNLTMGLITLAGLGVGIFVAIFLSHSIAGAIRSVLNQAEAIAAGDLTRDDLKVSSRDELGELTAAINGMSGGLKRMIVAIMDHSAHVASASEELSSSATVQAQGADTQKDQTTQVATAMQEMSATVHEVSENSLKAANASHNAAQAARQGGQTVQETLATMRSIADSTCKVAMRITELGKSSEKIGRIVAVIDDIADQTNLLALNAAIEAARAGEQGRGFAVVADEVRKLAERTAQATKEIAVMIESIQVETKSAVEAMELGNREVESGVKKTSASGAALKEIIKMSDDVGGMIARIATAATEQSSATEQIKASVAQISSATQESSVAAGQTAKACSDLSGMALDLQNIVSQFKLDSGGRRKAAAASAS
ncbi:MAG TPA: methyl-accepting chemotaxis protein [Candidatus Sulfotelmatobacter sp.]|nr:methyl-accepting chemotaxis protein [Candidatus Sulfotelmatobacter sp.]